MFFIWKINQNDLLLCRCAFAQRNKSSKFFNTNTMATEIINLELPPTLPHGWKKGVAKTLRISRNTVTNALNSGNGDTYERIMKCAKEKYGKPVNQTQHENN